MSRPVLLASSPCLDGTTAVAAIVFTVAVIVLARWLWPGLDDLPSAWVPLNGQLGRRKRSSFLLIFYGRESYGRRS